MRPYDFLLFAVVVAGCGQRGKTPPAPAAEAPRDGGTFVMVQDAPDRLDPACVDDVYEATIVNQVFDGLLSFDAHLETVPCVAASWVISPDGTVYTFELRPDVRFHDGTSLTADDVVYSLTRVFDLPADESSLAREYLNHILGSEEYARHAAERIRGLEALSPHRVRITLRQPYASFLAVLASELARIVPRHYVERVGADAFARHPVGSGPFRFAGWEAERIVLVRWLDYGFTVAKLDSLVYELPVQNTRDVAVQRFLDGRASAVVVPDGRLSEFRGRPGMRLLTRQELSLTFLGLNRRCRPFDDVRVRQAFALAIDRDALLRSETTARVPSNGILPPGMPGYTPESKLLVHDPAHARDLLAAAGFPAGRGLAPIVFTGASHSAHAKALFEVIRQQVAVVGFDLRAESLSWRDFSQRLSDQRLQCFNVTWVADIPDPDSFLFPLSSSAGSANFASYTCPDVDALLLHGRAARSSLARLDIYRKAERMILQDAPIVPLFHPLSVIAVQDRVRGLNVTAMGVGNLFMELVWLADAPRPVVQVAPTERDTGAARGRSQAAAAPERRPRSPNDPATVLGRMP
jgi:peptide/nickel transport system substrate-binding protein/oligopeptide transport system substrate-binding protein